MNGAEFRGEHGRTSRLFTAIFMEMYIIVSTEMEGCKALNA